MNILMLAVTVFIECESFSNPGGSTVHPPALAELSH